MIEVNHLTKTYGNHNAITDLTFQIEEGKIYGLLGPNGAGKSTTMNIMTGCLAPTSGSVTIDGLDIYEDAMEAKKKIGYLPELPPVYLNLTPLEYLTFVAKAKGVKRSEIKDQVAYAIAATRLENYSKRLIKNLSKGYRQRVGVAQALIGNPQIIILDEPTVGLDPLQIIEIRDLIRDLGKNHTVILSSHILSEVRSVCDHLIIIAKGKLVANDTPENLERIFAAKSTVSIVVDGTQADCEKALSSIENLGPVLYTRNSDSTTTAVISIAPDYDINKKIFFAFSKAQKPILSMTNSHVTLEDVFLELTTEKESFGQPEAADPQAESILEPATSESGRSVAETEEHHQ